jgi:integrase
VIFGETKLDAFTVDDIDAYKAWRSEAGLQVATINKDLTVLRAVLGRALEADIIAHLPCRIRRSRVDKKATRPTFTEAEIRRVLRAAETPRERMLILLAITCGLRREEICWLTWEDYEETGEGKGIIHVRAKRDGNVAWAPKSRAERRIPVVGELAHALKEYRVGLPPKCRWIIPGHGTKRLANPSKVIRKVFKAADCYQPGKLLHALRHTYATRLAEAGTDVGNVKELLGHASVTTTEIYMHGRDERKREAVEQAGLGALVADRVEVCVEVVPIKPAQGKAK